MASRIVYQWLWMNHIQPHKTLYSNKNVSFDKILNVCSACCLSDNRWFYSDRSCCSNQTNVQIQVLSDRVNNDCVSNDNDANNLPNSVKHIRNKLRRLHNLPKTHRTFSIENANRAVNTRTVEIGEEKVAHSDRQENNMNYSEIQEKFPFIEPKPGNEYEKVIETSYGVLRFDNKTQNSKEGDIYIVKSTYSDSNIVDEEIQTPRASKLSKGMEYSSNIIDELYFDNMEPQQSGTRSDLHFMRNNEHDQKSKYDPENEGIKTSNTNDIVIDRETKQQKKEKNRLRANLDQPESAYDMAMKIRFEMKGRAVDQRHKTEIEQKTTVPRDGMWSGQTDSHGFRILKNQVIDIENMPCDAVVGILRNSIIYEDDSMLAIDKPYGLPSHGGPGVHHSLGQLLEMLADKLTLTGENNTLYLVHRLDKDTTGVMLIAKNLRAQHTLHSMFVKRQVIKKYWLLTKGVPSPTEGVIDIPMAEGHVQNMHRMTLSPNYSSDNKLMMKTAPVHQKRMEAITNYRVLDSNNSAALVECQPETGLKHQIRCHMAFALNTPILGDHKYSHYSKIAPQRLYPDILHRLGIRQAKVRHLPMHLHAKQIILPEFKDGRNLFISASLPKHFVQNMKWLKIKPPK